MKNIFLALSAVATILSSVNVVASTSPLQKGHLVVFDDKKEGEFKNDLSIRTGTWNDLKSLKLAEKHNGVHTCFVGNKNSIHSLVQNMVTSANLEDSSNTLSIKNFTATKDVSIQVQVISQDLKTYLNLNIGPC